MRKIIAAMNMTLDGYCDHTSVIPNEEILIHYTKLLTNASDLLYGRTTYQLMESYWPAFVKSPSAYQPDNNFALAIDNISKTVFSRTLQDVDWKNSELKKEVIKEEILELKQQPGNYILVGSPSLIAGFSRLGLIDEYQLCVHPVIAGSGLPLFKNITEKIDLKLVNTKIFDCGAILLYHEPVGKRS